MTKEINLIVKPYDDDVAQEVFQALFRGSDHATEDGLMEIPADSYQLVVSALELIQYDVTGELRQTIKDAIYIVERLRDTQKIREWKRAKEVQ